MKFVEGAPIQSTAAGKGSVFPFCSWSVMWWISGWSGRRDGRDTKGRV